MLAEKVPSGAKRKIVRLPEGNELMTLGQLVHG